MSATTDNMTIEPNVHARTTMLAMILTTTTQIAHPRRGRSTL
jgi:hypothetical protein